MTAAWVQFQADEVNAGAAALTVQAVAANTGPFNTASRNVSSRTRTSVSVAWSPPDWPTVGARGAAQRTPDLKSVVQPVVDRTGWASGNALALVLTGSGRRTAEAFEDSGIEPELHLEYLPPA